MAFHPSVGENSLTTSNLPPLNAMTSLDIFPLATAKVGENLTIVEVKGGNSTGKRLMAMGMADGTILKVVKHNHTELIVSVDHRRFSLDIALACRIMVSSVALS
jgi:Fe2+ transport system protein FeoA